MEWPKIADGKCNSKVNSKSEISLRDGQATKLMDSKTNLKKQSQFQKSQIGLSLLLTMDYHRNERSDT